MRIFTTIGLWATLIAMAPAGAFAADCSLTMLNSLPLTLAAGGLRPLVQVTLNGVQKNFLLDTGGFATQIAAGTALELNLPTVQSPFKMLDMYGAASTAAVRVDDFALGGIHARNAVLPVLTHTFDGDELFPAFSQRITWRSTMWIWIFPAES